MSPPPSTNEHHTHTHANSLTYLERKNWAPAIQTAETGCMRISEAFHEALASARAFACMHTTPTFKCIPLSPPIALDPPPTRPPTRLPLSNTTGVQPLTARSDMAASDPARPPPITATRPDVDMNSLCCPLPPESFRRGTARPVAPLRSPSGRRGNALA